MPKVLRQITRSRTIRLVTLAAFIWLLMHFTLSIFSGSIHNIQVDGDDEVISTKAAKVKDDNEVIDSKILKVSTKPTFTSDGFKSDELIVKNKLKNSATKQKTNQAVNSLSNEFVAGQPGRASAACNLIVIIIHQKLLFCVETLTLKASSKLWRI